MFVGFHGRGLDFLVGPRQEIFCLGGVTAHIKFVGLLGSFNAADGLIDEALRGSQVGVSVGIDVLGNGDATGDECEGKGCAQS